MSAAMQVQDVGEKITVAAVFEGLDRVTPKWFLWKNRRYLIQNVEHAWRSKRGTAPFLFVTVTDGANVYELHLDQSTLEWSLEKLYTEG